MSKYFLSGLMSLLLLSSSHAGSKSFCPDLNESVDPSWSVSGDVASQPQFQQALIGKTCILGNCILICKYENDVNLVKSGTLQRGGEFWQSVVLGGIGYWQCLAERTDCAFYQVQ